MVSSTNFGIDRVKLIISPGVPLVTSLRTMATTSPMPVVVPTAVLIVMPLATSRPSSRLLKPIPCLRKNIMVPKMRPGWMNICTSRREIALVASAVAALRRKNMRGRSRWLSWRRTATKALGSVDAMDNDGIASTQYTDYARCSAPDNG